jgi:poly(3-hydroxybutyrate) depolymerase
VLALVIDPRNPSILYAAPGTIARIDPKRIYATDFSAGENSSYRLTFGMSDTFAANAPVEGWMFTNPRQPKQPVAAIRVHGTKDAYELSGISSRPTRSHEG